MSKPFLAIDNGNTNVTLGLCQGERVLAFESLSLEHTVNFPDKLSQALAEMSDDGPEAAVVASVNPRVLLVLQAWVEDIVGVPLLRVRQDLPVNMPIKIDRPDRLGDDRLMNGLAAYHRAKGAAIVVDIGTATTFDVVSANGEYLGGAIGPGFRLSAKSLHTGTAMLPEITPRAADSPIGKNSQAAMIAGVFFAQVGMAKEIIARMKAELGGAPRVFATGGDAPLIASHVPEIDEVVPSLTLEGLALAYCARRTDSG